MGLSMQTSSLSSVSSDTLYIIEMELSHVWGLLDTRSTLVGILVFVVLSWFLRRRWTWWNLPPGPTGWPFLGYIPQLAIAGEEPHIVFSKLSARYGNVISVNVAGNLVVVLHGYNTVKEAFNKQQLSARPRLYLDERLRPGKGIIMSSGDTWTELRRFSLSVLKSFGVGKSSFEEKIANRAILLIDEITKSEGAPFGPRTLITNATSNVLSSVVLGERYSDEMMQRLHKYLADLIDDIGTGAIVEYSAFVSKLTFLPSLKKYINSSNLFSNQVRLMIQEHNKDYDPDNPRDFIDIFLGQQDAKEKLGESTALNSNNLTKVVSDFFIAGIETSTTTLCWAILYMVAYPEVQTRVQKELDAVTSRNRFPRISDKPNLPYTQAVLCEIHRICTVNPLSVPHCASEDTTLLGYNIPKGTVVMSNLWHNHFDPTVWEQPRKFNPERFLGKDGNFVGREELTPFGIGRRICMGERLAKMDIFIFWTFLLHHFTFRKPQDAPSVSLQGKHQGGIWAPRDFEICAIPRG